MANTFITLSTVHVQVSLITCMMSADAPDTAGPDCWTQMELDYALVEVSHGHDGDQDQLGNPGSSPKMTN